MQSTRQTARWPHGLTLVAVLAAAVWIQGCEATGSTGVAGNAPTPEQVAMMPTEPNVVNVATYYNPYESWIWTEDKSRVRGIRFGSVYLIGPEGKGVFGDGVIHPKLYVMERGPDGKKKPVLTKEWSFTVEEAIPWRAKRETVMGWGYGLRLVWGDLDLSGREIRVVVVFERSDGLSVSSGKNYFPHVPLSGY